MLCCSGYVRERGLTANQLLHLPGAGDFQIEQIDGAPAPQPTGSAARQPRPAATGAQHHGDACGTRDAVACSSLRSVMCQHSLGLRLLGHQHICTVHAVADALP